MPVKQRRISRACDYCHQRSIRCRPCSNDGATCQNCKDFSQACTFNRTPRRRGVRPRASQGTTHRAVDANFNPPRPSVAHDHHPCVSHGVAEARQAAPTPWQAPFIASQATIVDLVELYFEIVYPIFPLFHQPTFTRRISRAEYTTTRSLFATTMAVCALVSGRVRDGSVTNPRWDLQGQISPDVFYHEARRQLAGEWSADLENIRAHAILAVAAIQNGRTREMQEHLGMYHTLVAMEGLHDEANWPQDIGIVEREERRRLVTPPTLKLLYKRMANDMPVLVHLHPGHLHSRRLGRHSPIPRAAVQRLLPPRSRRRIHKRHGRRGPFPHNDHERHQPNVPRL